MGINLQGRVSQASPLAKGGNAGCRDAAPARQARAAGRPRINCFTPGTRIATPRGMTPVEDLAPGDMVETRDSGPQEIRWVGLRHLSGLPLRVDNRFQPVVIRAGALGNGCPEHDLAVSPNHRVLMLGDDPLLDSAETEVFVSARHLVGTRGIGRGAVDHVTYLHFMFDRHEVVRSNGAWTESFRPGESALQGVGERAREELVALFPELAGDAPGFPSARPTLAPPKRGQFGT